MATQAAVNVTSSGSSPIATFAQTQNAITVEVQQCALVDPTNGTGAPVDANGLHVVNSVGTPKTSNSLNATGIAAAGSATLSAPAITSGKTGTLQHAIFSATQPALWLVQSVNNSSVATTVISFLTNANETFDLKAAFPSEISSVLSSSVNCLFQVVVSNQSGNANLTATAYTTFWWAEN